MNIKKICIAIFAVAIALTMTSCDEGSSSTAGDNYDYHDAAGNGYNDEDVNWSGGGKGDKSKSWDQAVNDWNREHGY